MARETPEEAAARQRTELDTRLARNDQAAAKAQDEDEKPGADTFQVAAVLVRRQAQRAQAERIVDELLGDLSDRAGFDASAVDDVVAEEWRDDWVEIVLRHLSSVL